MEGFLELVSADASRSNSPLIPLPISRERPSATASKVEHWFTVGPMPQHDLVVPLSVWDHDGIAFQWSWRLATWKLLNQSHAPVQVDGQMVAYQQSMPLLKWDSVIHVAGTPLLKFKRRPQRPILAQQTRAYFPLTSAGLIIGRGDRGKIESSAPRLELDRDILSISSSQAEIVCRDGSYYLINLNDNPVGRTILNGDQSFDERKLHLGDCLEIPNFDYYTFKFDGHGLRHLGFGGALRGKELTVDVPGARILHTVNLSLHKGELIGIVGGSGQGKSTLMNALCGIVPATGGMVTVDGVPLKTPKDVAKVGIGYVPQDDIVHKELTVDLALYYAARLRLKASKKEIQSLLDAVLDVLRLTEHRHKRISNLSGGQRKRVSIASELLTSPEYLFLDEPTSGLDPQTEKVLMGELSVLAKRKRIGVACTTHILQNCHVMSRLAFISRGRLIFCGKPLDAVKFFLFSNANDASATTSRSESWIPEVSSSRAELSVGLHEASPEFSEAYLLSNINRIYDIAQDPTKPIDQQNRVAETWESAYRAQYAAEEDTAISQETTPASDTLPQNSRVGLWASLRVLFARQWSILVSSKLNYTFLAAQALIIGFLIGWVDGNAVLQSFLAVIATLWFGCSNGAQQIVAELAIFRRERLAGLSIHGYLFSKVLFLGTLTVAQALMLYFTLQLSSNYFHHREVDPDPEGEELRQVEATKTPDEVRYDIPSKKVREFRMAFFDKSWQAIARGDDTHAAPAETRPTDESTKVASTTTSEFQDDDFTLEEASGSMAPTPMEVLAPQRTFYINPSGLRLDSLSFRLVEKLTFFFGLQENVLGALGVRQIQLSHDAPAPNITEPVSWQIHILNLLGLRFLALASAAVVGVMLGLAVSSLVNTPTQAVMWVPLILIPQILFGSFVVTIPEMTSSVLAFSRCLPSFNLHRIMDVAQVYGRNTTRVTNETKIPGFLGAPPNDEEIVKWDGNQTNYEKLSEVNKSWQNLLVIRQRIGKREKVPNSAFPGEFVNSLERRPDVLLGKGVQYLLLGPAQTSAMVLWIWFGSCYSIACISLYRRQTGR